MGRIEHLIAAQISEKKDPSEPEQISPQKKGYFSKRTPEDIEQDRLELIEQKKAKQAKHDFEQEQENERIRQHRPSRFEEDVSKIKNRVSAGVSTATKQIAIGAKRTLNVAAPAVKKVVAGTVKTVAPIVKQMGEGSAKINEEEKSKPKSTLFKPPKEEKSTRKSMKQPEGADDYFASGFSKKPPKEQKSQPKAMKQSKAAEDFFVGSRNKGKPSKYNDDHFVKGVPQKPQKNETPKKLMKQPEGADDFFVSDRKKSPPKSQEKKGKVRRGFNWGF